MKQYILSLLTGCLFISATSFAQDAFQGNWHAEYIPSTGKHPIMIDLKIGIPERSILYPAELTLQSDSFSSTYHLLLVKRNIRQLGIGRNKIASSEQPFSVGNWTIYLNGILNLSRDKAVTTLTAERIIAKQYGVAMAEPAGFPAAHRSSATDLRECLKDADIQLRKTSSEPFVSSYTDSILIPHLSGNYYGIMDTIRVNDRSGVINFSGNKKSSGVVSVILNGNVLIDQNDLSVRKPEEDIRLDTGLNILIFFADNYGKVPINTGNMNLDFGDKKFSMDFANIKDIAATFIVAKIYYDPAIEKQKENNSAVSNSILRELSEADLQKDTKYFHYPFPDPVYLLKNDTAIAKAQKALLREAKPVGNIKANARQIILALWDDAVEDGDSISLNINGHWVVQGFPVKKKPQFIAVTLDAGPNKILFIADNLGSIIPNTAILEIIDGRQRRSFMIDTDLSRNNLIDILYDVKPE